MCSCPVLEQLQHQDLCCFIQNCCGNLVLDRRLFPWLMPWWLEKSRKLVQGRGTCVRALGPLGCAFDYDKCLTILSDYDKSWTILSDYDKSWTLLSDYDKSWTILSDYIKSWTTLSNYDKSLTILSDYDKSWTIPIDYDKSWTTLSDYDKSLTILSDYDKFDHPEWLWQEFDQHEWLRQEFDHPEWLWQELDHPEWLWQELDPPEGTLWSWQDVKVWLLFHIVAACPLLVAACPLLGWSLHFKEAFFLFFFLFSLSPIASLNSIHLLGEIWAAWPGRGYISHKSNTACSCQCLQYFHVPRQWYSCQRLGWPEIKNPVTH